MNAMILVLSPRESRDLLNGNSSVLVRKRFPKDFVGEVYIYCAKGESYLYRFNNTARPWLKDVIYQTRQIKLKDKEELNGKVVARFWCDKVEEIIFGTTLCNDLGFFTGGVYSFDLYKKSCLTKQEMHNYLKVKPNGLSGYAIHIAKPKPLDEPKEIKDFYHHFTLKRCERRFSNTNIEIDDKTGGLRQPTKHGYEYVYPLTSAPRSGWCYVEVL